MRDLAQIQKLSPLAMLGSAPPQRPKGPVHWAFDDMPERERPTLLRECLARAGVHYELCAVRDVPFHVDLAMNALPGLMVVMGGLHASRRCGARELAAETRDDATLLMNLKGAHRIEQSGRESRRRLGAPARPSRRRPSASHWSIEAAGGYPTYGLPNNARAAGAESLRTLAAELDRQHIRAAARRGLERQAGEPAAGADRGVSQ